MRIRRRNTRSFRVVSRREFVGSSD